MNYAIRSKYAIWEFARRKIPQGQMLPRWLLLVRAILFPLDFFYWRFSLHSGYQPASDTWLIHGVRYSDHALRHLAAAKGEVLRVWRSGETVTLERLREWAGQ